MKRWDDLTPTQQAWAVEMVAQDLAIDPALSSDKAVQAAVEKLAVERARGAYFFEPDDRMLPLIAAPPEPVQTPVPEDPE